MTGEAGETRQRGTTITHARDAAGDARTSGNSVDTREEDEAAENATPLLQVSPVNQAVNRPKRGKNTPDSYDETARRAPRRNSGRVAYVDDYSRKRKRAAIEIGPVAIERTVHGKYEWRDASLPPLRGPREQWWRNHG